jgi:hypothetical protein
MKSHTAIYYFTGSYGTFIEWCLNYFTDAEFSDQLPFTKIGNAHKFAGNEILSEKMLLDAMQQKKKFMRTFPGTTNAVSARFLNTPKQSVSCHRIQLKMLEQIADNVIVLYYSLDNILWGENNIIKSFIEKTDDNLHYLKNNQLEGLESHLVSTLKEHLVLEFKDDPLVKNWGKQSAADMEDWELREFLSMYLYGRWTDVFDPDMFATLKKEFPAVTFMEIGELRDNFADTITTLFKKLNLPMIRDNIEFIHKEWDKLQYFKDRDKQVKAIVDSVLGNEDLAWTDLSIIDEAEIQRQLRNNGWEIRCYDLNIFPTNTVDLRRLLTK